MAAVEITISGVLYDKLNRTTQNVVLIGEASLTGLGVGGGPVIPPGRPPSPGTPTHPIALPGDPWWGQDLHPSHPIVLPGDPSWGDPHPAHPIVLPPPNMPTTPPPEGAKPPPAEGGWGYWPDVGWVYKPKPTEPTPKK